MILPLSVYGKKPTAQVIGVVNMDAYMEREKEEKKRIDKINDLKSLIEKKEREFSDLMTELRKLEG